MENRGLFVGLLMFLCIFGYIGEIEPRNSHGKKKKPLENGKLPPGIIFPMNRVPSGKEPRIILGYEAIPHSYPFLAALMVVKNEDIFLCGGSLLTDEWVLTAAHCVLEADYIKVYLGIHSIKKLDPLSVVLESTEFLVHGKYSQPELYNDIGLVKLPSKVKLNEYIKPVEIVSGHDLFEGVEARCLGWGKSETGKTQKKLRYVNMEVIPNKKCSTFNEFKPYITDRHLCTSGKEGTGSCSGDSGGPLMIKGKQVGVVSFGAVRCEAKVPSVFTRLTAYTSWLANKTGIPVKHIKKIPDGGSTIITPLQELLIGLVFSALFVH